MRVGKRIAANDRFALTGKIQLERNVLARLELREWPAIVRGEVKRMDILAFANFFGDLEFSKTVPDEFDLFDFLGFRLGGLNFDFEPFARKGLLLALEREAAPRSVAKRCGVEREECQQDITGQQADVSPKSRLDLLDKGLHFCYAEYNKALCPANI